MSDALEKFIDDVVAFTELSTKPTRKVVPHTPRSRRFLPPAKSYIVNFHEFDLDYIGAVEPIGDGTGVSGRREIFADAGPQDVGSWDVSLVSRATDPEKAFILERHRRVPLRELRGHSLQNPYVNEVSRAVIYQDGRYTTSRQQMHYIGKDSKGRSRWVESWADSEPPLVRSGAAIGTSVRSQEVENPHVNWALGLQFNREYEWAVEISYQNLGNPIRLTTDPVGARTLFSDRDKEEGRERRAALKHWVHEHFRKSRTDDEAEIFVRQHLRGEQQFNWKGYDCRLIVSPDDWRIAEQKRLERERMRESKYAER